MHSIETISGEKFKARVVLDDAPSDPRKEHDNVGRMVSFHDREHSWGDEQLPAGWKWDVDGGGGRGDSRRREAIRRWYRMREGAAVFLWIEHSRHDSTLRVIPDGGRADGFIYCTRAQVAEEWGADFTKPDAEGKTPLERAESYLRGEVETASQYYSGDVYGIVIEGEGGDELDSVWGFYGLDYALEEAAAMLRGQEQDEAAEAMKCERMMHV